MCMVNMGDKGQRGHRECIGVGVVGYMRGGALFIQLQSLSSQQMEFFHALIFNPSCQN